MAKYIPLDTLVAEIEKRISEYKNCGIDNTAINAKIIALENLLIYINTLEVKEVDLDKEIENAVNEYYNECEKKLREMNDNDTDMSFLQLDKLAKHFFKLGLSSQQK